jgi:hypothetical protein
MPVIQVSDLHFFDFQARFLRTDNDGRFVFEVLEGELKGHQFALPRSGNNETPSTQHFGLPDYRGGQIAGRQYRVRMHLSDARTQGIASPATTSSITAYSRNSVQALATELKKRESAQKRTDVYVFYPPNGRNRHVHYTGVQGTEEAVKEHVAWLLKNDKVTPCYEHMALTLHTWEIAEDGIVTARLYKSDYAGD